MEIAARPSWGERTRSWISEWRFWWAEQPARWRFLPALAVALYWMIYLALGDFRSERLALGVFFLIGSYAGPAGRHFLRFAWPLITTAVIYDSQKYYGHLLRGEIRVAEPYLFDLRFFGIRQADRLLTPNEWWQLHTHPALDLYAGFFYLTFFTLFVLIAAYFYFWKKPEGAVRMSWSFLLVNLMGYVTYYLFPAAPPWYVEQYGLGPARLDAKPFAAGCLRFDALLGTHFFSDLYSRGAAVFGAVPSLHVAYPVIAMYYAWRFGALRAFSVFFALSMMFSAVYLNHHYMLDVIWGASYAVIGSAVIDLVWDRFRAARQRSA